MHIKHSLTFFNFSLFLLLSIFSLPSQAQLSESVNQMMMKAQDCNRIQQDYTHIGCMSEVNASIEKSIKASKNEALQRFRTKDATQISKKIDRQFQKNLKTCMNEQAMLKSTTNNKSNIERRHLYCTYENMLELLINIESNIKIYLH